VPDGVNNGQFGIGLVIDFFGLSGKYSGFPVEFAYPSVTAVVPANIALVAGGKNPADARRFISFSLSKEGQELLTLPQLARLPILPPSEMKMPVGYPNAFEVAKRAKVKFDSNLSAARYYVVTALFDQAITFRHKELQAASLAIHQADAALATKPNSEGAARLKRARELAFTPPVSEAMSKDVEFLNLFTANKKNAETNKQLAATEGGWNSKALENYRQAKQIADEARALAK
ncbi:MAG: ABC transporter substrate-binding protein, partial [Alcaligenaceae bacterium]